MPTLTRQLLSPNRMVISWFGYDLRYAGLIPASHLAMWVEFLEQVATGMGMQLERYGNPLDLIIGKPEVSVLPVEFFRFQRGWDRLNEWAGLEMSGVLWLANAGSGKSDFTTWESYRLGTKVAGDSIGRPQRHSLAT